MKKNKTAAIVFDIVKPLAEQLSLDIWDVVFEKEGINWFLRVYIERKDKESVFIEDCENLSKLLSSKLDEIDPINESYFLEVSSPGLGRKLKSEEQLKKMIGEKITFKLIRPIDKKREFKGTLKEVSDKGFSVKELDFKILIKDCSFIKLNDDENLF